MNTYDIGRMLTSTDPQDRMVAEQIGVFFPNQDGRGTHVNISGAGVTRVADNVRGAVRLIEFLLSRIGELNENAVGVFDEVGWR